MADLLDDLGEIFRCDGELQGIPAHTPLMAEMLLDQLDELHEDVLSARTFGLHKLLRLPDGVSGIVDECLEKALHGFSAEVVAGITDLGLDKREEVDDVLLLLLVEMINGVHTREDIHRREVVHAGEDLVEVLAGDDDDHFFMVGTELVVVQNGSVADDDDVAGPDFVVDGVDTIFSFSLCAKGEQDEVHAAGFKGQWHVAHVLHEHQVVVDVAAPL